MKLLVVLTVCAALCGPSSGTPFFSAMTSAVSGGANLARGLAVNTVNAGVNVAKGAADMGVSAAKGTVNAGVNAVKATAEVGTNIVKSISTAAVNTGVDFMIASIKTAAGASGKALVEVPDIEQKFGPAKFHATEGYFTDLTTLAKDGQANVTMNGTSLVINVPLTINKINLGYSKFNASMLFINVKGGIRVTVAENQFIVYLVIKPGLTCSINVERVVVSQLDGIDVQFHDMGSTSESILNTVGNLIVTGLKGMIKGKVQEGIDSSLKKFMSENGAVICSKFLG